MDTKRDILSVTDLCADETRGIIRRARHLKADVSAQPLQGKSIALLFEKPSLRTRVSFQVAISQLGGYSVYLGPDDVGLLGSIRNALICPGSGIAKGSSSVGAAAATTVGEPLS